MTIGERDLGIWDSHTGGEIDSEESKYRPGGLAAQISLGGSVTVNNVTVGRLYLLERDHQLVPFLLGQVGKGDFIVTKQPLGVDGVAFGKPTVYRGKLKQVTLPEHDSESSDPAKIELEMSAATASQV